MSATRAAKIAASVLALVLLAACSREQQDWRSAQAADTVEAYSRFLELHPDSELATQARARVTQLAEERDWQRASTADTADAYRRFLTQYPNGQWAQEARIRMESFALSDQPASRTADVHARPLEQGRVPSPQSGARATPPQQTASPPPERQPASSGYGIQLGAFSTEVRAAAEWQRLSERFGAQLRGLKSRIVPATTASGRVYRLQADVPDEARARTLCDALQRQSQGCVVVLPASR